MVLNQVIRFRKAKDIGSTDIYHIRNGQASVR